jgi:hypothetical protein
MKRILLLLFALSSSLYSYCQNYVLYGTTTGGGKYGYGEIFSYTE